MIDNRTTELREKLNRLIIEIERLDIKLDSPAYDMTLGEYEQEREKLLDEFEQAIAATLGEYSYDWQAIADELNARAERTCRNENGNDKHANFICSECGLHMHKPGFGRSYVDEDGKRWYGTSSEHSLHYCPNCGAKVMDE